MKIKNHLIKRRRIYAVTGVLGISLSLLSIPISSIHPFLDELPEQLLNKVEFWQSQMYKGPYISLSISTHYSDFKISCPQTMKENETDEFRLEFDRYTIVSKLPSSFDPLHQFTITDTDTIRYKDKIIGEKAVELHSSGFKISPSTKIQKTSMTELPTLFVWTIKPESEGDHTLVLDISQLIRRTTKDTLSLENRLIVNEQEKKLDDYGILSFPVTVFTFWGISRKVYAVIRNIFLLMGFILMYPILLEWLKRCLLLNNSDTKSKDYVESKSSNRR